MNNISDFIILKNVNFSYDKKLILSDINLTIQKGEFISILGENGCGKSTLVKLIKGLLKPNSGNIIINEIDTKNRYIFNEIGLVLQNPDNQIVNSIVEDDIAFGPENTGLSANEVEIVVKSALNAVGLEKKRKSDVLALSGGEKQRLAIASILAMSPECIILDEPTAMLDYKGKKTIMDVLLKLNNEFNKTIILITHRGDEAILTDKVIVMQNGQILKSGTPEKVLFDEKILKKELFEPPSLQRRVFIEN